MAHMLDDVISLQQLQYNYRSEHFQYHPTLQYSGTSLLKDT